MLDIKKVTYDSERKSVSSNTYLESQRVDSGYVLIGIACGYVSTTEIFFEHEAMTVRLTAQGEISFLDHNRNLLASICDPADDDGRGCYVSVCCKVEENKILLRFPVYQWVDHYPDCDSENDRWDARVTGYKNPIAFDLATCEVAIIQP